MPLAPELPLPDFLKRPFRDVTERLEKAFPVDAKKQVLRAQYTTAVGVRLAFFLSQGVLSSRVSGSSTIDGAAAAAAIVKAVLDTEPRAKIPDKDSNLGNIVRNAADGRELSPDEAAEVSQVRTRWGFPESRHSSPHLFEYTSFTQRKYFTQVTFASTRGCYKYITNALLPAFYGVQSESPVPLLYPIPDIHVTKYTHTRRLGTDTFFSSSQFLNQHLTCIVNLFRDELQHLENGVYKFPYDLNPATTPKTQWNPLEVFSLSTETLTDQGFVRERRSAKNGQDLLNDFSPDPNRYPAYYLQNFHYQTDGWLSTRSARLYDFQVETLFLGPADTMRRQVLPYVSEWMREFHDKNGGENGAGAEFLDVASGTGRFLTFLRDNW